MGVLVPSFTELENLECMQLSDIEDNKSAFLHAH